MKTLAIAALAALLLAGPALASEPAGSAAAKADPASKPAQPKQAETKQAPGPAAPKQGPKAGEAAKTEAPCQPVKPCPID